MALKAKLLLLFPVAWLCGAINCYYQLSKLLLLISAAWLLQGNAAIHILRSAFGVAWSDRIRIIFAGDDLTDEDAMKALKVMNVKRMDARVIITRVMIIKIVFARRVIARLLIVQMMFAQTMMAANKREKEKGKCRRAWLIRSGWWTPASSQPSPTIDYPTPKG